MKEITIYPTVKEDFVTLYGFDHSFDTSHVWQMDIQADDHENQTKFRVIRLPRIMQVDYPYHPFELPNETYKNHLYFTAKIDLELVGYCNFYLDNFINKVIITDLIVERRFRRNGIASKLLSAVTKWTIQKSVFDMQAFLQSKNYPAIKLLSQFGFEYSGYNDRYFENQDIALIFNKSL